MTFEIIPAIDLLGAQVVRLERGDLDAKTVYADDAVAVAREWERLGAARLHVVDLEGAVAGAPRQRELVEAIVAAVSIPVQVSGGIRTLDAIDAWFAAGADRVVLGTAALTDETFLAAALERAGDRLVVAPDARDREVQVSGWLSGTGEDVATAAVRLAAAGVRRLIVTDVGRDGLLVGPNVELLEEVARSAGIPVIASGGVATVEDLCRLAEVPGIEGAILGRALYSGAIDLGQALRSVPA